MICWDPIDIYTDNPYQVVIGKGVSALLASFVDGSEQVAIICSDQLRKRALDVARSLPERVTLVEVPDAEAGKTAQVLQDCWAMLADAGFTRSDAVVGLGGGATTDLAGFVAATWLRGVRYIAMPTTVLGMVDAAVGGKTGINLPAGKNLVGAFYEPYTVLGEIDFLDTLPERDWKSGFAEVLKAGFICDPAILELFCADPSDALGGGSSGALIHKAVSVKAKVVSEDFREQGSESGGIGRAALNYGHTLGHAIERRQGFAWRHGEAVSIGMVFAAEVALRLGLIDAELVDRHRSVLRAAGLPVSYAESGWEELRDAMSLDKKARGRQLRFVLLHGLAAPQIFFDPPERVPQEAFRAIGGTD
ncbi:MAG: 3-dehydroquinate synthase [Propionibacteriaceae bacterium]|jgi:3-dehydroquinate synthase|nr:3-dehydroquinate synthase [Propionibacteriaceae bacterium]